MYLRTRLKVQYGKRRLLGINKRSGSLKRGLCVQSIFSGKGFFSGEGAGIVTVAGLPSVRRVFLFDIATMMVIRSTWSRPDGTYLLLHLDPKRYYLIMARDHLGQYEPIAYDWMQPEIL